MIVFYMKLEMKHAQRTSIITSWDKTVASTCKIFFTANCF